MNEGPHGLRLVQALQAGEVEAPNAEAMVLQKPRRLNYEIARADLLVAIAEAEDYRRLVREQLVAAVKETKALLEHHHRHINGSFDGELAARRAVHICLYVDHALRTAGKQLAHALSVYQLDITSRWASESVVAESNELAKQMRVEF